MQSPTTIARRIAILATTLVTFCLLLGAISITGLVRIRGNVTRLTTDTLPGVQNAGLVSAKIYRFNGLAWRHIAAPDMGEMDKIEQELEKIRGEYDHYRGAYQQTITQADDRENFAALTALTGRYFGAWEKVKSVSRQARNAEAYQMFLAEVEPLFGELGTSLLSLQKWNREYGERTSAAATAAAESGLLWTAVAAILAVACGLGGSLYSIRQIRETVGQIVRELALGSQQVAAASGQVSASSQSLAQGANEQAASVEETSASTEEVNAMARRNCENAGQAANLVERSQEKMTAANRALELMVTAITEINAQSDKISKIIKTIDEIAFQTNLLALNAAVEAARAGDSGMGFAVVADEVRNLAHRSAQAAKDTTVLIEESISKSQTGVQTVSQLASVLEGLTGESAHVRKLVDEMNQQSREQARGVEEIARAITQIDHVVQRNAAGAEETAAAAEQLNAQSETLNQLVDRLAVISSVRSR